MKELGERRTVQIESAYSLMQVFNAINEERQTLVFVYNGIKFWRENNLFMVEREDDTASIGSVVDFEEFKRLLRTYRVASKG